MNLQNRLTELAPLSLEQYHRMVQTGVIGEDEPLETPPHGLSETLQQLGEASERLNEKLSKTSRHVVSLTVVTEATEIIQLVKLLRGYLN